jgi:hypothetical protein
MWKTPMILMGKISEHFQTLGSVTIEKCGIPLNVHIMVTVELVQIKGEDDGGMQCSYMGIEVS